MTEDNKDNPREKPSYIKESYLIIGAFVLMLGAIFTIWQVLLKGKMDEEISKQKDTIVQVKTDTVKIIDSIKKNPTQTDRSKINNTEQVKDTSKLKSKLDDLSKEDKTKLKEKFEELPKSKQERIKKKLRTSLNK